MLPIYPVEVEAIAGDIRPEVEQVQEQEVAAEVGQGRLAVVPEPQQQEQKQERERERRKVTAPAPPPPSYDGLAARRPGMPAATTRSNGGAGATLACIPVLASPMSLCLFPVPLGALITTGAHCRWRVSVLHR